jgi:Tol biopolymer transport system component
MLRIQGDLQQDRRNLARNLFFRMPQPAPDQAQFLVTVIGETPSTSSQLGQLVLLDETGQILQAITPFTIGADSFLATSAAWSPDGMQIVFRGELIRATTGTKVAGIYTANRDGSNLTRIIDSAAYPEADQPAWSPDGKRIAFVASDLQTPGNKDIFTATPTGDSVVRLTTGGADDMYPTWSPDSALIAFVSVRDGNFEIYSMNADGRSQRRLTRSEGIDTEPAWSPDGRRIAFVSVRGKDTVPAIYIMDRTGVNPRRLITGRTPRWFRR